MVEAEDESGLYGKTPLLLAKMKIYLYSQPGQLLVEISEHKHQSAHFRDV